jgi:hypothetical protein
VPFPNFLIIGAQKAGTTALYHYLSQHPRIFMSPDKEPRYFANSDDREGVFLYKTRAEYERLFDGVKDETAIGEASTLYMCSPSAPEKISASLPGVKLIAVLRNPIDRAYSQYVFMRREGREKRSSFRAVIKEEQRLLYENPEKSIYLSRGMYGEQIERYLDNFSMDQLRLYRYENLLRSPGAVLNDMFRFLGVVEIDDLYLSKRYNVSHVPGNPVARRFVAWASRQQALRRSLKKFVPDSVYWKLVVPAGRAIIENLRSGEPVKMQPLDDWSRQRLSEIYWEDLIKLESLTGYSTSAWR